MGAGDAAGGLLAIGRHPALPQPVGRIGALGVGAGEERVALARQAAQHGIGEGLEVAGVAVGGERVEGKRDGGVVGDVHEEDLRGGDVEDGGEAAGAARHAAGDEQAKGRLDLAVMAERGADNRAGKGPVAGLEGAEGGIAGRGVEQAVEGTAVMKDGGEKRGGGIAGGGAGAGAAVRR